MPPGRDAALMISFEHARRIISHRRLAKLAIALSLVPALSGCILTADKLDPTLDVPKSYHQPHGPAGAALPAIEWWRGFRSAELIDLMEQAQAANLDIAAAVARIVGGVQFRSRRHRSDDLHPSA
jgi:multidrug efflux system outer membrane protein